LLVRKAVHVFLRSIITSGMLLAVVGCRCSPGLTAVEPARVTAEPLRLMLPATYVGRESAAEVEFTNSGGQTATLALTIDAPFVVTTESLQLVRGQAERVRVTFAPTAVGFVKKTLRAGELELEVEAEGLEVPMCLTAEMCVSARFDFDAAQCREEPRAEGTVCETSCVTGACEQGVCIGQLKGCNDADACTVDACSVTAGCSHAPVVCPVPTNKCHLARCDSASGCAVEDALDGTLCGPDDCRDLETDVCVSGQCTRRPRPATGRCANRWVPMTITARAAHAMAWDAARQKLILFGGGSRALGDTWEWDGARWTLRTPTNSPPGRLHHRMVYDAFRQRIVLFGGRDETQALFGDTWEWDGVTWVQRTPAISAPPRADHAMVYDSARRRVVLFSGYGANGYHSDTWEWDGASWTQRTPQLTPPARYLHAMAYDEVRQRTVLLGGYRSAPLSDHWEWDGTNWAVRAGPLPPGRAYHSLSWDGARARIVLFGGQSASSLLTDTWEWDGASWTMRAPQTSPPPRGHSAMAYDARAQRVVMFGGYENGNGVRGLSDTWEWDGTTWTERAVVNTPSSRVYQAMTYDSARQRVVLFGGSGTQVAALNETWEYDGTRWMQRTPVTSPPARSQPALTYDSVRQRTVLYGGNTRDAGMPVKLDDTWEWDGTTWSLRASASSPGPRAGLLTFDSTAQRAVLFGGSGLNDTWEWDGTSWSERHPTVMPPLGAYGQALVFDGARQRTVLFGGEGLGETWQWDGTNWSQSSPVPSPAPRTGHALAYDSNRQLVLLYGGFIGNNQLPSDTWEWNGTSWLQRTPVSSPLGTYGHSLAYDAARQRMVLFQDGSTWVFLP
jgi:hypothetical protein